MLSVVQLCSLHFSRDTHHERMLDDQDDARSAHSIGIVENPLYADQDESGEPSYANLASKEKEAEVRLWMAHTHTRTHAHTHTYTYTHTRTHTHMHTHRLNLMRSLAMPSTLIHPTMSSSFHVTYHAY